MTEPRDEEIAALRQALAGAMGRNVELQDRLDMLERERNELGIDEVARSVVGAARAAVTAMTEVGDDGGGPSLPFVIPRLEVTMKGLVGRQGDGFAVRFPGPEGGPLAPALSTISMIVAHVPAPRARSQPDRLRVGLEAIQATMSAWDRDRGRQAANEITAVATRQLGSEARSDDATTVAGLTALADAIGRFMTQAADELDPATREQRAASVTALSGLARQAADSGTVSPDDLAAIGTALADLADGIRATGG